MTMILHMKMQAFAHDMQNGSIYAVRNLTQIYAPTCGSYFGHVP